MLLGLGNIVRFIHTGTEGKIVDRTSDGMFIVALEGGIEIPAFPDHLERVDKNLDASSVKGKVVPGKSQKKPEEIPLPKRQYELLKDEGILMAFVPFKKSDGTTQRYSVYLINATLYQATFDWGFILKGNSLKKLNGMVDSSGVTLLMEMQSDYLSDNPTIVLKTRQISTRGMTDWIKKEFKLKPKQFFQKSRMAPLLDRQAFVYKLVEPYEIKEKTESLEAYTQKNKKTKSIDRNKDLYRNWTGTDVKEFAQFPLEKDLHIEQLVEDYSKMNNSEIIQKQIQVFNTYLSEAIKLGVSKVFVIHGIGKGKLKNEIATILFRTPEVKTFKNEYHPKYGNGATEIIFN